MRIAIIGAGSAGLAALRHCTDPSRAKHNLSVVCYEKTDKVGGTWVYVPETGKDRHGLPIHSSMYDSLRTNLPKEVMGYPDFPVPENPKSYLTRTEILQFLNDYCDHFKLRDYIRFDHNVELVSVSDAENAAKGKWKIRVRDLENDVTEEEYFDGVMVCNGHYFEPSIPKIKGMENFKGQQLHSHDYRIPEPFAGKTVVVFGAGPSGMDLALEISRRAKRVILSHHLKDPILTKFPDNVVQKSDVAEMEGEDTVIFQDGSKEKIDCMFYCTGYKYSFPFLDESCGVKVVSNMVTPLWKHIISIENPTLALIGIPFYVCAFSMFDLQVRFVLRFWLKDVEFPPKKVMLADEMREEEERRNRGFVHRQFHMMGPLQGSYYDDIANVAGIKRLPPVLTKLHNESSDRFLDDLVHYREDVYKIIDEEHFLQLNKLPEAPKAAA